MKSIPVERILQVVCILVLIWAMVFVRKVVKRSIPDTDYQKVEIAWEKDSQNESLMQVFKGNLENIRQPQSLVNDDLKRSLRNPFIPPLAPEQEGFWVCDNCGGKNLASAAICIHCGYIPPRELDSDEDGIPDYWEMEYEFDPNDADDAHIDPDKDGRDNFQEFIDETNPLISDLRGTKVKIEEKLSFGLVKTYQKPVQIIFMGYIALISGQYEVQINWGGKTAFYKIGENVRGYIIKDFQKIIEEVAQASGVPKYIDRSFIICQKKKFPAKKFFREKLVTDNDVFARIQFSDSMEKKEIHIDYRIEVPLIGKTYIVLDIGLNPQKIIVEDETKKSYTLKVN